MARDAILLLCLEGRQRGCKGGNSVFTGFPSEIGGQGAGRVGVVEGKIHRDLGENQGISIGCVF